MTRAGRVAFWLAPPVFCLALYWNGLWVYFLQDDFAWLGLRLQIWDFHSLLHALFAPMAQGTIRPISERGFFILYSKWFGLDPLPYRITVFVTMFAATALLAVIVRRLTGSAVAGVAATLLWLPNWALVTPMTWTSAYNEVLCTLIFLSAFYFLLRHIETGSWKFYWMQTGLFVVGFGVLEVNVVYPALAAAYTLFCARRFFRRTLPLFALSGLYAWLHLAAIPKPASGVYAMHFDTQMFSTYFTYWGMALSGGGINRITHTPEWVVLAAPWVLGAAILAFSAWKTWKRNLLPVFGLAWFTIVLLPLLPLRDHISEYYLTIPLVGLALVGGVAVADMPRASWVMRTALVALCGYYLFLQVPFTTFATKWTYARSNTMRNLMNGVSQAHQLHPGKVILLAGVTDDLFWGAVYHNALRLTGAQALLVPGSEKHINLPPQVQSIQDFIIPEAVARKALMDGDAVAYTVEGDKLRNVTRRTRLLAASEWSAGLPRHVEVGQPLFRDQIGPGWYPIEGSYRWMSTKANLYLGGPSTEGQSIVLHGYCPEEQLRGGPLGLSVTVDGKSLGTQQIHKSEAEFELTFPLPAGLAGQPKLSVTLEVSRPYRAPHDSRVLGLVFGTVSVR